MTTSTVAPEIAEFASAVRAALADLPADELDELTDGLEADLSESLAEDLRRTLPDPIAYAAELRLAAGLPVRAKVKTGRFAGIADNLSDTRRDIGIAIRRNPTLAGIADFLVVLQPLWWVVRAWLATWLVAAFFGSEKGYWFGGTGWFFVLAAFITVSVQWGRGQWRGRGIGPLIVIGNVVAIIALLPVIAAADSWGTDGYYLDPYTGRSESGLGMTLNGASVTNIFAYGADGKPLTNIQLFDQDGRPLVPHLDPVRDECGDGAECEFSADGLTVAPAQIETGASVRNVFPLSFIRGFIDEMTSEVSADPGAVPEPAVGPFLKVPAVQAPEKVAKAND